MNFSTGSCGTRARRRIMVILAGLLLVAVAAVPLVGEHGMGSLLAMGAALLLLCLGVLSGVCWTSQILQPRLRELAEERRRMSEEWAAVHAIRQRPITQRCGRCPRCAGPLALTEGLLPNVTSNFPPSPTLARSHDLGQG